MTSLETPRRGDIWMVDLPSPVGVEAAFVRPAVVVSNNTGNEIASAMRRGVITVVPITSNVRRVLAFQTRLSARRCGLRLDSKAQAEQIRAIAVERLRYRMGRVPRRTMNEIDAAIRLHLSL